mmetsp:Transcript_12175/g.45295  ORF Transcript_12175/g.45295 Transcript_12175/m.45295 type:complete len:417 (+) Transcript_12175:2738-3988(+)
MASIVVIRDSISVFKIWCIESRSSSRRSFVSRFASWSLPSVVVICPRSLLSLDSRAKRSSFTSATTSWLIRSSCFVTLATCDTRAACSSRIAFSKTIWCSIVFWRSFFVPCSSAFIWSSFSRIMSESRSAASSASSRTFRVSSVTRSVSSRSNLRYIPFSRAEPFSSIRCNIPSNLVSVSSARAFSINSWSDNPLATSSVALSLARKSPICVSELSLLFCPDSRAKSASISWRLDKSSPRLSATSLFKRAISADSVSKRFASELCSTEIRWPICSMFPIAPTMALCAPRSTRAACARASRASDSAASNRPRISAFSLSLLANICVSASTRRSSASDEPCLPLSSSLRAASAIATRRSKLRTRSDCAACWDSCTTTLSSSSLPEFRDDGLPPGGVALPDKGRLRIPDKGRCNPGGGC